jgi:prepilin-type N-terminal cleavage/methylation domain-containing protein/prepilin-type processing-associated H-X9-DG protein
MDFRNIVKSRAMMRTRRRAISSSCSPTAFTLVELLVVIAIIGILVALLLPAIQAAREAARRSSCQNNFRQVALALQNYHSTNRRFPPGTTDSPVGNNEGYSWAVWLLQYIEGGTIYDQIDFKADGFIGDTSVSNQKLMNNTVVATYNCPSSQWPQYTSAWIGDFRVNVGNMVGIAGALPPNATKIPAEQWRWDAAAMNPATADRATAWNGILFPHSKVHLGQVTDGSSHVMAVGETSGMTYYDGHPEIQFDCRGGFPHGWWEGADRTTMAGWAGDVRAFNTTYIAYRPLGTSVCTGGPVGHYRAEGTNYDNQVPIQSAHPGGAHVVLCDGSVQFLSDSIDFDIFRWLAIRDSDQSKPLQ